jgi:hypothetical protein
LSLILHSPDRFAKEVCDSARKQLTDLRSRVTVRYMKSKLAEAAEQQLIEDAKRMTREQRLRAFIKLSKHMIELQRAGRNLSVPQVDSPDAKSSA